MIQLYKACFISNLDYFFIAGSSLTLKNIEKLEVLQRKLLRRSLGLMNNTPNLFVYSEAGEIPVRFRQELILVKYIFKDETQVHHISHKFMTEHLQEQHKRQNGNRRNTLSFTEKWRQLYRDYQEVLQFNPIFSLKFTNLPKAQTFIPSFTNMTQYYEKWEKFHFIYSDGSRTNSGIGAAVFDPLNNYQQLVMYMLV